MADSEESVVAPHSDSSNHFDDQMVDRVILDMEAMVREDQSSSTRPCCIYKVPHIIRKLNEDAYTPKVVSIGPFHYGNPRLQNMERVKQIFFKEFIKDAQTSLGDLVSFVKSFEPDVRACYFENIKLNTVELVKVILLDASFIIKLFCHHHNRSSDDVVLSKPWLDTYVTDDLLLLENQLPYFILEKLFNRVFPPHTRRQSGLPSFLELNFHFFSHYNAQKLDPNQNFIINHFTDLLRTFHLERKNPYQRCPIQEVSKDTLLYSASELHDAGVKFKASTNKCLLGLKFSGGVLEIPQIKVQDDTETLFRNMIALEQCHYPFESYVTDYTHVLDHLTDTSQDVDLLVHKEIIQSHLPDTNEVAKVFKGLGKNILRANFNSNYVDICRRLNGFYKNPWHKMKATLRSDYCKTPWQTAASIAGIFLVILSLVEVTCSVLQVAQ